MPVGARQSKSLRASDFIAPEALRKFPAADNQRKAPNSGAAPDQLRSGPMLTRRKILLVAGCAALAVPTLAASAVAVPSRAADATALAFVTAIYDAYRGKDSPAIALNDDRALRRYFEPTLAALIRKDRKDASRRGEAPILDGDPFVDANGWEIAAFDITMSEPEPGKAVATVRFTNSGTPKTVVLDLVRIRKEWRISDIVWQRDGKPETLRGLFAH